MTGRMYSISFTDVSVSAAQDLINITATAGMAFRIHRIEGGQRTVTAWEAKPLKLIRFPATVTAGSGGSTVTPVKLTNGDAAATVTARSNDTTPMTTNGTATILLTEEFVFLNGFLVVFTPDERPVIAPSQGVALNLPVAPSGATSMSFTLLIEELF
jgi:hypothetical protein